MFNFAEPVTKLASSEAKPSSGKTAFSQAVNAIMAEAIKMIFLIYYVLVYWGAKLDNKNDTTKHFVKFLRNFIKIIEFNWKLVIFFVLLPKNNDYYESH